MTSDSSDPERGFPKHDTSLASTSDKYVWGSQAKKCPSRLERSFTSGVQLKMISTNEMRSAENGDGSSEALRGRKETAEVKIISSSLAVTSMDQLRNEDIIEMEHL